MYLKHPCPNYRNEKWKNDVKHKIQTLQKRLIAKTEEVVEKELVIQQKEKLYTDIKLVLQRQPGPEVIEELQVVRSAVKTKNRESKVHFF